ncbi:histidine kinase [Herbiconiux sp. CPCC 205716]|uniref:histidine kinase n=1 Tax=Herbiconiux gentiana TaxID=2970912 RepID=A0ABT2GBV8_9MICO|nr:ATP-binding protein [Herbiconiux gentiana]MCS5713696.1 histidine kinase [Herbiconiux gentiana]
MGGERTTAPWVTLAEPAAAGRRAGGGRAGATRRALVVRLVAAAALVVFVVVAVGVLVARRLAEDEAVNDAARSVELLADVVVEPALGAGLVSGETDRAAFDELIRARVIGDDVVRVKLWNADGTILYSDEPRLIGETFGLDEEELEVLEGGGVESEVSDLSAPENRFERGRGTLLEAYHSVATGDGEKLLFEAYFPYDRVSARTSELWTAFSLLSAGSVLALLVLLTPVGRRLFVLARRAQAEREAMLLRAVDASSSERMRIAGRLHDGAIQDLTASILALRSAASTARRGGDEPLAGRLDDATATLHANLGGLRTLLVDLYPPSLTAAGIRPALDDLAAAVRGRGVEVRIVEGPHRALHPDEARLVFRVVREVLANVVKHARATTATVELSEAPASRGRGRSESVLVEISDDGRGFDPQLLRSPASGHVGIPLLVDAVQSAGAGLAVSSTAGGGTRWRLELPGSPAPKGGEA